MRLIQLFCEINDKADREVAEIIGEKPVSKIAPVTFNVDHISAVLKISDDESQIYLNGGIDKSWVVNAKYEDIMVLLEALR